MPVDVIPLVVGAGAALWLNSGVSVPQRLLRGLQAYHLVPGDADAPPPEASKKDKKAGINPAAVEYALNKEGAAGTNVGTFRVTAQAALVRPLYRPFAAFVSVAVLCAACAAAAALLGAHGATRTALPVIAFLTAGQTARALLLAQLDSACTPPAERQLSAAVAFATFAACFATLVFSAEARVAFGLEQAAAAVGPAFARLGAALAASQTSMRVQPPPGPPMVMPPAALAAALAAGGGVVTGLLAPAGVRWARSFALAAAPPAFAQRLCGASTPALAAARAAFVATAAAAAAPIALPAHHQPALLLAAAALHAVALRPMAQAYLDSALVSWHELRYAAGIDVTLTLRVMHARFEAASRLLVKVATQLAAPAAFALAAAVVLAATPEQDTMLLPAALRRTTASFLGAAACAGWVAAASTALAAFRLGLLKP